MDDDGPDYRQQQEQDEQQQQEKAMSAAKVYEKIASVAAVMASEGISKGRKNQQQGYNFRGIDDVYNALAPVLASHGLCILPRIIERECIERASAKGGALFYVTVTAEFDVVAAEDGSKHTIRTYGEAMDSADKATNKAMSAAYKYAAMQMFCIPTEGDNDADSHTHDVALSSKQQPQPQPAAPKAEPKAEPKADPSKLADHIAAIDSAADMASLKSAFDDGVNYARSVGDRLAEQAIIKAKDARKAKVAA